MPAGAPLLRWLVHAGWIAGYAESHARFRSAIGDVAGCQRRLLLDVLRRNADTRFGRTHRFSEIRTPAEYQSRVEIRGYDAFAPDLAAIADGATAVLTRSPVLRFQPTSGSSGGSKRIPWTADVAADFRRGVAPWLYSLYHRRPELMRGTAYWSISPPVTPARTDGKIPVGFEDDVSYLGFAARLLFNRVNAVPPAVARAATMESFKDRTLAALLANEDLALVSVWSPTFLTLLLQHFAERSEAVVSLMRREGGARGRRRAEVVRGFSGQAGLSAEWLAQAWPRLRLISCWTDGPSELHARRLQDLFPEVEIQGKGLIATEAFVSFPIEPELDPVLAIRSHFFEFVDAQHGTVHLADQLELGRSYSVIVTTGGGLYRYALGDRVRVTGFLGQAPCLRFIGRQGNVADLCGEKLEGVFVQSVMTRALAAARVTATFSLLAPSVGETGTAYTWFLEAPITLASAASLSRALEELLCENFHYAHCRRLGQLRPCRVFLIDPVATPAVETYHQTMIGRGQKLGDIKVLPLDMRSGWEIRFRGRYADGESSPRLMSDHSSAR